MLDHRIYRREFLRAFVATEMFGFLMVMKNHFILEGFLAVEAKWPQTHHISAFTTHVTYKLQQIKSYLNN
jgi:hypothetical protein